MAHIIRDDTGPGWSCPSCGQGLYSATRHCSFCRPFSAPKHAGGWTCPSCGHSYAPWVPECHHCPEPPAFIAKGSDPGPAETGLG